MLGSRTPPLWLAGAFSLAVIVLTVTPLAWWLAGARDQDYPEIFFLFYGWPTGRPGLAEGAFEKIVLKTSYLLVFELAGDELHVLRLFNMSQDWRSWADDPDADV